MFSSATTETATMVVRLFVASREVFVASRRNYEITASSEKRDVTRTFIHALENMNMCCVELK